MKHRLSCAAVWPYLLLWVAAPAPLYIWAAVEFMLKG